MSLIKRFNDRMVTHDDLIITNPGLHAMHEQAAPHGRLFEVLGRQNGRRVVREVACNTVVVGGAITALENLMGVTAGWKPDTLNKIHNVEATGVSGKSPTLCLFGIGTGGANLQFGSVIAPSIKQKDILSPIPMRYLTADDPTGEDAKKYFMKVAKTSGGEEPSSEYNSWFLKAFSDTPTIKTCWKNATSEDEDGTVINTDISGDSTDTGIETFTEIQIDMNTLDGREYFEATSKLTEARYNTIGFYTGVPNADNTEYADVRLYSAITFNNRDLSIRSSSSFIYRVYSLI